MIVTRVAADQCKPEFAGALDVSWLAAQAAAGDAHAAAEYRAIFGDPAAGPGADSDLSALAARLAGSGPAQPALYQCCDTGDSLYADNLRFRDHARSLGLHVTYEEGPGTHEWGYWDRQIQRVLEWLPLAGSATGA